MDREQINQIVKTLVEQDLLKFEKDLSLTITKKGIDYIEKFRTEKPEMEFLLFLFYRSVVDTRTLS